MYYKPTVNEFLYRYGCYQLLRGILLLPLTHFWHLWKKIYFQIDTYMCITKTLHVHCHQYIHMMQIHKPTDAAFKWVICTSVSIITFPQVTHFDTWYLQNHQHIPCIRLCVWMKVYTWINTKWLLIFRTDPPNTVVNTMIHTGIWLQHPTIDTLFEFSSPDPNFTSG